MIAVRGFALVGGLTLTSACLAQQKPAAIETEHIFGFTEGSDIGDQGELEFESTTVGAFGKPGGYAVVSNELAARYGVIQGFRAALGVLTDYHNIHDSPGLNDVSALDFSGVSTEFRWAAMPRAESPFGLTLSFAPYWRRIDATGGGRQDGAYLPLTLLVDRELLPGKLVAAFNAGYGPSFARASSGPWLTEHDVEISTALAYQIQDGLFLGGELRHEMRYQIGAYPAHALFVGPSFFVRLSESMSAKIAWSAQIPGVGSGRLNLGTYERHEVLLLISKTF